MFKPRILALILVGLLHSMSAAQDSPHGDIKIPCESCHTTDSWKMRPNASFNHTQTGFVLDGQHKAVACENCHQNLKFNGASNRCSSCHTDIHKSQLGANCLRCHTTRSWQISDMIQKHQATRFPLVGTHATLPCEDCHSGAASNQYVGTPTSCIGCHRSDYVSTTNPNHAEAGFSTNCEQCHAATATAWDAGFDHNTLTRFPLTGAHRAVACASCHQTANFKSTPTECYPCHTAQFVSTSDPPHVAGGFPTDCKTCHTTTIWRPSTFTHDNTRFPLTGAHRAVPCNVCHTNNQYATLSTNCIDCHRSDFTATTNPNHQASGFPTTCALCHSTTSWQPASFNHTATKFPLTGFHASLQCQACHANNNYQITYTNCYQCHSSDFAGATNPNHVSGNFSQNCQTCHTTTAWQPATFDHSSTKFPLTGAHTTTPCQSCHTNNNYQLSYTGCYSCHASDYNATTNPNHTSAGFPTTCETCHSTTSWAGATFNHTWFPTNHGNANGVCANCHTNTSNYAVFTCTNCHGQSQTDSDHRGVQGYVYNSANCYSCHPSGRSG